MDIAAEVARGVLATLPAVFLSAMLAVTAVWAWPSLRMWKLARKLPGPTAWPLVGNALILQANYGLFELAGSLIETHGPVVRLWFGTKLLVLIASPANVQLILTHPRVVNRENEYNETVNGLIKNGLLTSKDEVAREHRKLMEPAFHYTILRAYMEVFGRKADQLCERLDKMADGQTLRMRSQLSVSTLDSICETAIGIRMEYTLEQWIDFRRQINHGFALMVKRLVRPWQKIHWMYSRSADAKKMNAIRQTTFKAFQHAMDKQRILSQNNTRKNANISSGNRKIQSFLDAASLGENCLTDAEIKEQILTLAAAGMDTTANTMAYVLMLLGIHPEYQERVFQEQQDIFQSSLRPATADDLPEMTQLDCVIKETLRLFPPVAFFPREIPEDLPISNGLVLPAGCSVYIYSYGLQRDGANFVHPDTFWPERWTPENSVGRHPYAFVPFGAGVRNCIGQRYAQLQMKATLSRLLRQFRFTCGYSMEDLKRVKGGVTIASAVGYDVQIYTR